MEQKETSAVRLEIELEKLSPREVSTRRDELIGILRTSRDPFVLAATIRALASSPKISPRVLRDATRLVKEPLALTDLLEVLGEKRDPAAANVFRRFATRSPKALIRGAALESLGLLGRPSDLPFLKRLERSEKNRYARASLLRAMHRLGAEGSFDKLLDMLRSRDYRVRCRVANLLADVRDPTEKLTARRALRSTLNTEGTAAVRSTIRNVLKDL